jgi:fumarate reductase subunit C
MAKTWVRPIPATWWLRRRTYFLFIVRELTSVFVAGYVAFLLVMIARAQDEASFARFYEGLACPASVALHVLTLLMVLFHAITWINLTPKVMVVWRGEQKVSPLLITGANYAAWLVVSGLVLWLVLR